MAEYEDILGYHLEQAYRYRIDLGPADERAHQLAARAGKALANAGNRAVARDDHHAAAGLLRRALELVTQDSPERRQLRYQLAEEEFETSGFQETSDLFEEVLAEAKAAGDRRIEALATTRLAWLKNTLSTSFTVQAALDEAAEATRTLQELGDEEGVLRTSAVVGFLTFILGHADEALAIHRVRLERAIALGSIPGIRTAVQGITGSCYYGSTSVPQAIQEIERLQPLVAESPATMAEATRQRSALYAMAGRFDEARAAAEDVRARMEAVGSRFRLAGLAFWIGPMHMLAEEYEEAERVIRESIETFEGIGDKGFVSTLVCDLAEALLAQGRPDEAEELAERGRALGVEDDIVTQIEWRRVLAKTLAIRGELEEAERLAREAIEIGEPTDYISLRGDSWVRLAEVLRMAGRSDEAAGALRHALELYERKGNVVLAERARRELADLGGS